MSCGWPLMSVMPVLHCLSSSVRSTCNELWMTADVCDAGHALLEQLCQVYLQWAVDDRWCLWCRSCTAWAALSVHPGSPPQSVRRVLGLKTKKMLFIFLKIVNAGFVQNRLLWPVLRMPIRIRFSFLKKRGQVSKWQIVKYRTAGERIFMHFKAFLRINVPMCQTINKLDHFKA